MSQQPSNNPLVREAKNPTNIPSEDTPKKNEWRAAKLVHMTVNDYLSQLKTANPAEYGQVREEVVLRILALELVHETLHLPTRLFDEPRHAKSADRDF